MDRLVLEGSILHTQAPGIQGTVSTHSNRDTPLSPILYLFYNADRIEACKIEDTEAVRYVDEASILAVGPSAQRNCKPLKAIHRTAEKWALQHGSRFAPTKD
jgi:hypothetical protein